MRLVEWCRWCEPRLCSRQREPERKAAQDRLRTANGNIASATRILEAIKQRFKAGTGTDLDVAQQEAVLANQRALVPPLRQTLAQNVNALATLVARPPESVKVRLVVPFSGIEAAPKAFKMLGGLMTVRLAEDVDCAPVPAAVELMVTELL